MEIIADTREHASQFKRVACQLDALNVKYFRSKLFVGDYQSLDNARLVVDRKKDLQELASNVTHDHERFKAELIRAQEAGIKLIILCEHGPEIKKLADVEKWLNPRRDMMVFKYVDGKRKAFPRYPYAITGTKLHRILCTIQERYGVDFVFCTKQETGAKIVELLGGGNNGE